MIFERINYLRYVFDNEIFYFASNTSCTYKYVFKKKKFTPKYTYPLPSK